MHIQSLKSKNILKCWIFLINWPDRLEKECHAHPIFEIKERIGSKLFSTLAKSRCLNLLKPGQAKPCFSCLQSELVLDYVQEIQRCSFWGDI